MSALIARLRSEPALVLGFVAAVVALVASFGFRLSTDQLGALMAVVTAGLAFVTRSQVVPTVKVIPHVDVLPAVEPSTTAVPPPVA